MLKCYYSEVYNVKCFYHANDHDGHCSKAIVQQRFPKCETIGVNYGDKIDPVNMCEENEIVYVCDYCFHPFQIMIDLSLKCRLVFCDHHLSAMERVKEAGEKFKPVKQVLDIEHSGCENTWLAVYPDEEMPETVRLLGRYDVFDIYSDNRIVPFEYGLRSLETLDTKMWERVLNNEPGYIDEVVKRGFVVIDFLDYINSRLLKSLHETEFMGYPAYALNYNGDTSLFFNRYQDTMFKDHLLIVYTQTPSGTWSIGLTSSKSSNINVTNIAKKFGGGGHTNVAGLTMKKLPDWYSGKVDLKDPMLTRINFITTILPFNL